MRILITGGAGFIGSHITDQLIREGHRVVVVDNLVTGSIMNVNPQAAFYRLDICEPDLAEIFEIEQPQIVIHHAAQVSVQHSITDPLLDANVNILGTINLCQNCIKYGVRKIIYASSAAAYGEPQYLGIDEVHPVVPISFYGISKHTPEHYLAAYNANYGLEFTVLRYANVFGPRQGAVGEGGVISTFFTRLLTGEAPEIYGDGEQTRDFIFVEDVVAANLKAFTLADGKIINISTNTRISINNLYQMMQDLIGTKLEPIYREAREGDILHSYLANTHAQQLLNWKPLYSLAEGLKLTLVYFQNNISETSKGG